MGAMAGVGRSLQNTELVPQGFDVRYPHGKPGIDNKQSRNQTSHNGCSQDHDEGERRSISTMEATMMAPVFEDLRHDSVEDKAARKQLEHEVCLKTICAQEDPNTAEQL